MPKDFGEKVAAELRVRARDRETFEQTYRALDSYPAWARDKHKVVRMPGQATARLSYKSADVSAFYVRKGRIVVHPRSADIEVAEDVEAAVDRMAVLLAHAIVELGDDVSADEAGAGPATGRHLVKLADGRRA